MIEELCIPQRDGKLFRTSENCLATCHDPRRNINLRVILPRNDQSRFPNNLAHAPILGVVTNHLFMRAQNYCS